MFVCVWIVFSTKDRHVDLCVDGVQHQGQACSPVSGWCSALRTGMLTCVWMVFSTKDSICSAALVKIFKRSDVTYGWYPENPPAMIASAKNPAAVAIFCSKTQSENGPIRTQNQGMRGQHRHVTMTTNIISCSVALDWRLHTRVGM
ncbi:hypothetical protein Bbelb_062440 [Branchiostoma belcheri]|nr:hypothetical protein Bbelb_062440 [Branchiostoma belcheri]